MYVALKKAKRRTRAIRTLVVSYYILDIKCLLYNCALESFLLNGNLDFYPPRVRFRPQEKGVDQSDFGQSSQFPKTQIEELLRLWFGGNPVCWRLQPSVAVSADMEGCFSLNAIGNVDREFEAVRA